MTWTLPPADLQTFRRNPLRAVIWQLRFAPILKVNLGVPEFQDQVRGRFPGYQESSGIHLELAGGAPRQREVRQHRFLAKGEPSILTLEDMSVSLEYGDHRAREVLLSDAELVCRALSSAYRSVAPQRLGVRYVNTIDLDTVASALGRSLTWQDVLTPEFVRFPTGLADEPRTRFASEITSPLPPGEMTVRMGLLPDGAGAHLEYRLDVDRFVVEDFELADVHDLLIRFVDDIYRVFRAAAGSALLEWMNAP